MKYVTLSGIDAFSEKEGATNPIYVLPHNIVQIEPFSGPFHLQAYGPDGKVMHTGRFKQVLCGSLVILAFGGVRIIAETPAQILENLAGTFD